MKRAILTAAAVAALLWFASGDVERLTDQPEIVAAVPVGAPLTGNETVPISGGVGAHVWTVNSTLPATCRSTATTAVLASPAITTATATSGTAISYVCGDLR